MDDRDSLTIGSLTLSVQDSAARIRIDDRRLSPGFDSVPRAETDRVALEVTTPSDHASGPPPRPYTDGIFPTSPGGAPSPVGSRPALPAEPVRHWRDENSEKPRIACVLSTSVKTGRRAPEKILIRPRNRVGNGG